MSPDPNRAVPVSAEAGKPWWSDQVEEAFRAYGGRLRRFVLKRAREFDLPESALNVDDIVQETFVRVMEKWDTVKQPERYLYTVARRLVVEIAKETGRCVAADVDTLDEATGEGWSSLPRQATVENQVIARLVIQDVQALPGKQAAATLLRHMASLTSREIGHRIDCSSAAARVHVFRGTSKVREHWSAFQSQLSGGRPALAEALMAFVAAGLLWGAATALLWWMGLPMLLAMVCPAVIAAGVAGWLAVRRLRSWLRRASEGGSGSRG